MVVQPLTVEVVYCPAPRQALRARCELPPGSTVADALAQSALVDAQAFKSLKLHVGVWGRKAALHSLLREGDRVEIYRGLTVDPKEARRVRYRAQGEKLPKGIHRPRHGTKDMTQSPGQVLPD